MYAAAADQVWWEYAAHLSGNPLGLWCIVSERPLGEAAQRALSSSAAALGFGEDACAFIVLETGDPADANLATDSIPVKNAGDAAGGERKAGNRQNPPEQVHEATGAAYLTTPRLTKDDLFLVVEGVDPLCVVAADVASAKALAATYRQDVPVDARCRLFGRDAVAFRQFEALLDDSAHKQKAWALLKQLPRLD